MEKNPGTQSLTILQLQTLKILINSVLIETDFVTVMESR